MIIRTELLVKDMTIEDLKAFLELERNPRDFMEYLMKKLEDGNIEPHGNFVTYMDDDGSNQLTQQDTEKLRRLWRGDGLSSS